MNDMINNFKQELIAEIMRVYELEYPTASGEVDEFYHDVLNIIRNSGNDDCGGTTMNIYGIKLIGGCMKE